MVSNKNSDSSRRVITFSDSFATHATQNNTELSSTSSQKISTSFRQLPMHLANLFHCNATDYRSHHFLLVQRRQSGATQQHTNTTGDQCLFAWARAIGRGISDSSNNISPLVAMTTVHMCSSVMARRCRLTLQPTRHGEHTSMTLRQHWRWPKTCWSGDRVIQTELCQEC